MGVRGEPVVSQEETAVRVEAAESACYSRPRLNPTPGNQRPPA